MGYTVATHHPELDTGRNPIREPEEPSNRTTNGRRDPWLALVPLVLLGGISGIAYYLGFVRPYRLDDYYNQPLMDLAKINFHAAQAANAWLLTWVVVFACYILAFRLCPPATDVSANFRRVALVIICGWAAFSSINVLFMYPVGAADLFDQIFRARLLGQYHLNPFTTLPNNIQGDPFQPFVAWAGDPSPYGPVWELLAGGTSLLGGDSLWRNLVLFKVLVLVAYGINIALTYGILRVVKPDWALRGTLFFAWNPLMIFEVAGNGHNDSIVVTFLLAAVYLFVLARRYAVIPALMAGALTKFVPIILIPVAAAAIWRDRIRAGRLAVMPEERDGGMPVRRKLLLPFESLSILAVSSVIALGLAAVLYAPFWRGFETVGALGRKHLFTASLPKVALDIIVYDYNQRGTDQREQAETLVSNVTFALTVAVIFFFAARIFLLGNARNAAERQALIRHTLSAFYEIIFFYLAFVTLWFQPWYLVWLVALTAPVARYTNATRTILFCIGGVANYFVWDFLWLWNGAFIRDIQVTAALAVYTLPIFYTFYVWAVSWMRRAKGGELEMELSATGNS